MASGERERELNAETQRAQRRGGRNVEPQDSEVLAEAEAAEGQVGESKSGEGEFGGGGADVVFEEVGGSDEEEGVDQGEENVRRAHGETLAYRLGGRK